MKSKTSKLLLIFILILAFGLRFFNLDLTPNGVHADEASFYINAMSITETGMDEDGNKYPLSIKSFIDPKPALYSYFQIPFIQLLSNPVAASRMPSVVFGVFSLFICFLLIKELASEKLALITTTVIAISPWHIVMSRGTQEVILSFFFLVLSLLMIVVLQKKEHTKIKVLTFTFSAFLSMYFYHSAKVLLPLLVAGLLLYFFKKSKAVIFDTFIILFLTVVAFGASVSVQESLSRASAVSLVK